MALKTYYFVKVWMLDENGEPLGGGHTARLSLNEALEGVEELMSKRIARVKEGKVLKCEITVYEHEEVGPALQRIRRMMLALGFPLYDCE